MKKSLRPLSAPPPKLTSPAKSAMRAVTHALALGGLLVGGAVWTISQQHPLYANPGKLLRLPAAVVDEVIATAKKAGWPLPQAVAERSRSLLAIEIKGLVANQLYKGNDYYTQVLNTDNESYRAAVELLSKPGVYNKYLPAVEKATKKKSKK